MGNGSKRMSSVKSAFHLFLKLKDKFFFRYLKSNLIEK